MLASHDGHLAGSGRIATNDIGLDLQRFACHRQHASARIQKTGNEIQPCHRVAELVPEGHDEQVAHRVTGQRAFAAEPVLQHIAPNLAPRTVVTQRRQGHAQIAWRQDVELLPQPPGRAPIVGDRDDRCDAIGDQSQRC